MRPRQCYWRRRPLRDGAMFGDATDDLNEAGHLTELQALIATGLFTGIETET